MTSRDVDGESTQQDGEYREETIIHITREMYETLRSKGFYNGEDAAGNHVHISEDFRTIGPQSEHQTPDAWSPVFEVDDRSSEIRGTKPVADSDSKAVLLRGEHGDTVEITEVHSGMWNLPERLEITRRVNTYYGPALDLKAPDDYEGQQGGWKLTCPGRYSHPILWRAVTDQEGFVQSHAKVASVSVEIRNIAGYDICGTCEEPIKDPMHRSLAMLGQCPGGMNENKKISESDSGNDRESNTER